MEGASIDVGAWQAPAVSTEEGKSELRCSWTAELCLGKTTLDLGRKESFFCSQAMRIH